MIRIVYITDENYAMPTAVSIVSLIQNSCSATYGIVYIVCDELTHTTKNNLKMLENDNWRIVLIDVMEENYSKLAKSLIELSGIHVSRSALFKFNIPDILRELNKVLYLDSDIIVCRDISDLFFQDITGYYLAATDDMGDIGMAFRGEISNATRIGLEHEDYFNSGVMLLNLELLRNDQMSEKMLEYRKNKNNYFMDQDAFNYCLHDKRMKLKYEYNFRTPICYELEFEEMNDIFYDGKYNSIEECLSSIVLLHLSDRFKPWDYEILLFTDIFMKYYALSPYSENAIRLKSPMKVLFNEKLQQIQQERQLIKDLEWHQEELKRYRYEKRLMDWKFPYSKIKKGSRIVIYGAGNVGKNYVEQIKSNEYCEVVLWVDTHNVSKENVICSPREMINVEFDYVIIAVVDKMVIEEIVRNIEKLGIDTKKIVSAFL